MGVMSEQHAAEQEALARTDYDEIQCELHFHKERVKELEAALMGASDELAMTGRWFSATHYRHVAKKGMKGLS